MASLSHLVGTPTSRQTPFLKVNSPLIIASLILLGQAEVHALLEQCYEKAHDLLTSTEATTGTEKLREEIASFQPTEEKTGSLRAALTEARHYFGTLTSEARHFLGNLSSRAYNMLKGTHAKKSMEPTIDPKLESVEQELSNILLALKKLRTEHVFVKKAEASMTVETTIDTFMIEPDLKEKLEERLRALQSRLHAIDERRQDGRFVGDDGSFAPKGQAYLTMLLEEAYSLVYEMQE